MLDNTNYQPEGASSVAEFPARTRHAICGLSTRGVNHFLLPLLGQALAGEKGFDGVSEVVGIYDIDEVRVRRFCGKVGREIPWFGPAAGVDAMIAETRPDVLLVAGPDHTHCDHILAGLRHGLRVIAEKPVVVNCEEMRRVLAAERESAGSLVVTHNLRYTALNRQIKRLLSQGVVGRVTNIEFVYNLDTRHGSSYFYRWNRVREKSGGLSVHKSVHHIDLISWLIDSPPEEVFAFGALNYYGPQGAHRPKGKDGGDLSMAETRRECPYFRHHYAVQGRSVEGRLTPGWDSLDLPYTVQYPKDTYIYDPEIDIEDTYSSVVRFANGASMTYSLNFSTPWEGFVLGINGTEGRLEVRHRKGGNEKNVSPAADKVVVLPLFGGREEFVVQAVNGGHQGADPMIRSDLFVGPGEESLELGLPADSYAGAVAVAAGEALWRSVRDGRPYSMRELLGSEYRKPERVRG